MFEINMWTDENGNSPVDDFLDKLYTNNLAILKKTQKIPSADLNLALERKEEYARRQEDDLQRKA